MLPKIPASVQRGFRLPYINGQLIVPATYIGFLVLSQDRIAENIFNIGHDNLQQVLFLVFVLEGAIISVFTFARKLSLIPIMGVLFCSYLLMEIPAMSWLWFLGWMTLGLCIYFLYGYKKSNLRA